MRDIDLSHIIKAFHDHLDLLLQDVDLEVLFKLQIMLHLVDYPLRGVLV
jgi:hypothetical protein